MPYYRDIRHSNTRVSKIYNSSSELVASAPISMNQERTVSYRTSALNDDSVVVSDSLIDPHGYYLPEAEVTAYRANLEARGIKPNNPRPDRGHPFETCSFSIRSPLVSFRRLNTRNGVTSLAAFGEDTWLAPYWSSSSTTAGPFVGNAVTPATFPSSDLSNFGQRAIAKKAPTLVQLNLGQILGELREGLPRLGIETFQARAITLRGPGSDFLNVTFGWLPLISDIRTACDVLLGATELLEGLPEQGRPVRRTWGLPPRKDTWQAQGSATSYFRAGGAGNLPDMAGVQGSSSGSITEALGPPSDFYMAKTLTRRQWFVGMWTTFYPLGFDPQDFVSRARHMLSLELTPEVLWELTPWSWLIDWYAHIQASITATSLAADESLHMHYAYAMEETKATVYSEVRIKSLVSGANRWEVSRMGVPTVTTTHWKRRVRANPFGFTSGGFDGLNAKQKTILLALGLART